MVFLHPALLATAGGLALLPLLIHLLSRRGYQSEPWAAMMFLLSAQQASRRRLRVERWLLLAVRTLVVIFLGLSIARPLASGSLLGDALAKPRFDRVIVMDDSLSMRAVQPDGSTSFDAAKALARRIIEESEPRDGLALVAASRAPRSWMDQPMHDRQALRGILDAWTCSWATDDVPGAIRLASELLSHGQAAPGCRLVYWIGDRTRTSFESLMDPSSGPADSKVAGGVDRIYVLDVGSPQRENVGIASLSAASQIVGVGVPARFNARIVNFGAKRVLSVNLDVLLDGAVVTSRAIGPLEARGESSEDFELLFNSDGPHRIVAKITGNKDDVLSADDTRHLGVQVTSGISVLAVDGSDDTRKTARDLFYYTVAVAAPTENPATSGMRIKPVSPLGLEAEVLGEYNAIVLGNVRRLPDEAWRRIDRFVRAGGGLLFIAGDRVQMDHYNQIGAEFAGLISVRLDERKIALQSAEPWRIAINEPRHLALADLAGSDRGGLGVAQVRGYWGIQPWTPGGSLHVPIRLSNGDPLLIQSEVGQGRVLTWLTSANMTWNNLPAKPDYVPLMLNLTLYAAGCDRNARDLVVGQSIVHIEDVSPASPPGVVLRPDGPSIKVDWTPVQSNTALVYHDTDRPGFYVVTAGKDRSYDAVNIDPRESDLTVADDAILLAKLGPNARTATNPGQVVSDLGSRPPREWAPLFMVLLLALLSTETLLATVFRGRT